MIIAIGEILFDMFPDYKRIGGAPFNFAYHINQMKIPVQFISRIGKDNLGQEIMDFLTKNIINTEKIQIDESRKTGTVKIEFDENNNHSFEIIENVAYDFISDPGKIDYDSIDLIYFGTLCKRNTLSRNTINSIISKKKNHTKCFYDINLRPNCYTEETVLESLEQADILKLNIDELEILRNIFKDNSNENSFVQFIMKKFKLTQVVLTRGEKGSAIFSVEGSHSSEAIINNNIKDTVGAGDAYSAVVAYGLVHAWANKKIIEKATSFSSEVCTMEGALPQDNKIYDKILN